MNVDGDDDDIAVGDDAFETLAGNEVREEQAHGASPCGDRQDRARTRIPPTLDEGVGSSSCCAIPIPPPRRPLL